MKKLLAKMPPLLRKYATPLSGLALLAAWSGLMARFVYKIGKNGVPADFVRPGLMFFLLASVAVFMAASQRRGVKIASRAYVLALGLICALVTLAYRYFKTTDSRLNTDHVYATLQSDLAEAVDYGTANILTFKSLALSALIFFLSIAVLYAAGRLFKDKIRSIMPGWLKYALPATFMAIAAILFTQIYPVKSTYLAYHNYYTDLNEFNKLFNDLKSKQPRGDAVKKEQGELYVLVIGESQSRDFMHCYTGPAENTPWMDSLRRDKNWIVFENAYSCHTHTVPVLCMALTTGRTLTGATYPAGQNFLTLSQQAGIHTVWLSNQANLGPWDSPVSAMAHLSDTVRFSGLHQSRSLDGPPPDEVLLPMLDEELRRIDFSRNTLLVIHLMGDHGPYLARVPKDFPRTDITNPQDIGALKDWRLEIYNKYLTSIRYADDILREIHSRLAAYADKPVFMLYFADHGDDVFVEGGQHNFSQFTWTMARIPMFIWTSPAYAQRYPDKEKQLRLHGSSVFTNDLIYDLYVGLANIQTKDYAAEYDISNARYTLSLDNAVIADGLRVDSDPQWNIRRNAQNPTLAMHRANTIFKTRQGQIQGIRNFEIDLVYTDNDSGRSDLMVGHDAEAMTGRTFAEYLAELNPGIDWLSLDIKNLNEQNSRQIYDILSALDADYQLRDKVLIETGHPDGARIFAQNGWETSYYLPWSKLMDAAETSPEAVESLAADISAAVRKSGIGGISYDLAADEVVSANLVKLLPPGIKRYAWTLEWKYEDKDLAEKMRAYPHLSRLLIKRITPFSL